VVRTNLKKSFPEKTTKELLQIESDYYQNLCDWIIETIKLFTISADELKRRMKFVDEEKWNQLAKNGRQIIIAAGHFNNFEWGAQRASLNKSFKIIGLFTPLSNNYFNNFILKNRSRFGAQMIAAKEITNFVEQKMDKKTLHAIGFVADQSPRKESKVYWTQFLNQETAVFTGVERYALQLNAQVIFVYPKKIKRGYYELRFELICNEPELVLPFIITETQTRFLENLIKESPASWMWSHKRWKLKRNKSE
jgi:KDO2-lipid IV(A) lauroyltransferase